MSVNKIQFTKNKNISKDFAKIIRPRKMPNSASMSNEIFQKGGGSCMKFYEPDLLKMATMSLDECKKYREFLISTGKFYEVATKDVVEDIPEWIRQVTG